ADVTDGALAVTGVADIGDRLHAARAALGRGVAVGDGGVVLVVVRLRGQLEGTAGEPDHRAGAHDGPRDPRAVPLAVIAGELRGRVHLEVDAEGLASADERRLDARVVALLVGVERVLADADLCRVLAGRDEHLLPVDGDLRPDLVARHLDVGELTLDQ